MSHAPQKPSVLPPDFHEERNGSHLLVWGDAGQWLVVDGELHALLQRLDGSRNLEEAVAESAGGNPIRAAQALPEARETVAELRRRGLIRSDSAAVMPEPKPVRLANLTFNITNRCNLKCAWCYNGGRLTEEMDIDALMDSIEKGAHILSPDASFIVLGGEPFLDFPRLLRTLQRAESIVTPPILVSTNGTLVTEEIASALKARRVEVQVSLDAPDREGHDAVRGPGAFDRAVQGARRLIDAGVYTVLSMVYTRSSPHGFEAYLDFSRNLGANEARFIPMRLLGRGALCAAAPNQAAAFRELSEVLRRRKELRPLLRRDFFSILFEVCRRASRRGGCGIGQQVAFIDANGDVYPCPNHVGPEHWCGNLRERHLASVVEGSAVLAEAGRRYRIENYTRCATCPFRRWCAGDCRGETLSLTGDPWAPSPHCEELKAILPEIFWQLAGVNADIFGIPGKQSTFLT